MEYYKKQVLESLAEYGGEYKGKDGAEIRDIALDYINDEDLEEAVKGAE